MPCTYCGEVNPGEHHYDSEYMCMHRYAAQSNAKLADTTLDSFRGSEAVPVCPEHGTREDVELCNVPSLGKYICQKRGCEALGFDVPEPVESFRVEFEARFPSLDYEFIALMDEIGKLGRDKYGENAVENRVKRGDFSRSERIYTPEIAKHAANHFTEYMNGIRHDVYGTRKHQLASAAFNPMMEFTLAKEDK